MASFYLLYTSWLWHLLSSWHSMHSGCNAIHMEWWHIESLQIRCSCLSHLVWPKNISEEDRALASSAIIINFISLLVGRYSRDAIANYISDVWAWHILHYLDWQVNTLQYLATLKGARVSIPSTSKRGKYSPCLLHDLIAVWTCLQLTKPKDTTIWACITSLFYGMACMKELTLKNKDKFIIGQYVNCTHIR